jgi:hypothetical protein
MQLGERADFLRTFIWSDVISHWIPQRNSIKFWGNLEKNATEALAKLIKVFGEEIISRTRVPEWNVQAHEDQKAKQVKSKVKNILIISFNIKGIV